MRPLGISFDGSCSLSETQHLLEAEAGNAVCLPHFTPTILDNLRFVHHFLQTFCELDICCALTGTSSAYIAGVLVSYYRTRPVIGDFTYLDQPPLS